MKKIMSLSIYFGISISFLGCATVSGELSQNVNNEKNYSPDLWQEDKKYIVFRVNGSSIEPLSASSSPYSGNKEGLHCITTAAEPCKDFPDSNLDLFTRRSHEKFANNLIDTLLNGGTIKVGLDDIAGEKVFDPTIAQNALNILTKKIYTSYQGQLNNTTNLLKIIKQYDISTDNDQLLLKLGEGYNNASSTAEKAEIESYLINKSLIKFSNFKHSTSKLKNSQSSGLLVSSATSGRDYTQNFTVSLDKNAGIPIKYNAYDIDIKVIFYLDFNPPINGKDKDYLVREKTVRLSPKNGYKEQVSMKLADVPYIGFVKPAGLGFLTGMGKMLGIVSDADARDINRGIPFELKGIQPKYEVVNIKVAK